MTERDAAYFFGRFDRAYHSGSDALAAQGALARSIADAISEQGVVPSAVISAFEDLRTAWLRDDPDPEVLRAARLEVWAAIVAKNGTSTTIADDTDRLLRAILCLADLVGPEDAADTAGWAAEMLSTEPWPRKTTYF